MNTSFVTVSKVLITIRKLCIPAEAIKYSGHLLSVHLTLLFNMCLCHSFVPGELINTTVVPLLKNKSK